MREWAYFHHDLSGTEAWELFLLRLRYRDSELIELAANKPVPLDDGEACWITYKGDAELFAVELQDEGQLGKRHYLFTARAGLALFGITAEEERVKLFATGTPGAVLLKVKREALIALARNDSFRPLVSVLIDNWISGLSLGLVEELVPRDSLLMEAGQEYDVFESTTLRVWRQVLWISHSQGASNFVGRPDLPLLPGTAHFPVTAHSWLTTTEASAISVADTESLLEKATIWLDLDRFHQLAIRSLALRARYTHHDDRVYLERRLQMEQAQMTDAFRRLASTLRRGEAEYLRDGSGRSPLLDACYAIGAFSGIVFRSPPSIESRARVNLVEEIARSSGVRARKVALRDQWWKYDNGPLLGFIEANEEPVALLPDGRGYVLYNPSTGSSQTVDEQTAYRVQPFAYSFYRTLPEEPLRPVQLLRFGLRKTMPELRTITCVGLTAGLIGIVLPVITQFIFNSIIPASQRGQLLQVGMALFVSTLAIALFNIARGIGQLRLETRVDAAVQSAIMDRLLNLPATFFGNYTAGDLGQRALAMNSIRTILSQHVLSATLSLVFSVFSFALLFYYDVRLAVGAVLLVLILGIIMLLTSYLQMRYQREFTNLQGELSGTTLQLINGIAKLRVAGAQRRAFVHWARHFADQRCVSMKAQMLGVLLTTFNEFYVVVMMIVVFGMAVASTRMGLTTGEFLAFNAAFSQFMAGALAVSASMTAMVAVVPLYERAQPILSTPSEIDRTKAHPGELSGRIEVSHVSFRYDKDGPLVLDDVSLEFSPGEFVALVGPSGSGKSTLLRLLLGFETPDAGAILYDKQDLAELDIQATRRQIGVVLQNGKLFSGDMFTNIVGAAPLTREDAWEAAEKAGLADDIRAMPMGMHTIVSEGARTLSGGQRQRLLIARSIVKNPRIIIFDEATSALDNRTQAIVSQSLEQLEATRIVIAHRLSTIANADRIYVLENGRIVQHGPYERLMRQRGLFADMARRQILQGA